MDAGAGKQKRLVIRPANTMVAGEFVFEKPVDFTVLLRKAPEVGKMIWSGDIVAVRTKNIMTNTFKVFDVSSPVPARCFLYISRYREYGDRLSFRVQYSGYESHMSFILRVRKFLEQVLGVKIRSITGLQKTVEYSVVFEGVRYFEIIMLLDRYPETVNIGLEGRVQYYHANNTYIVFVNSMLCIVKNKKKFYEILDYLSEELGAEIVGEFS